MASRERPWRPASSATDISALFVVAFAVGPFLLPAMGVSLTDVAFACPAGFAILALVRCMSAAARSAERRAVWLYFGTASAAAAASSLIAVAAGLGGFSLKLAYYSGLLGSVMLLAGAARLVRQTWRHTRPEQLFDALLIGFLLLSTGLYFIAIPSFVSGDVLLAVIFLIDLVALLFVMPAAGTRLGWRLGLALSTAVLAAAGGDALVAAASSGQVGDAPMATAALWTLALASLAFAARQEDGKQHGTADEKQSVRWPFARALSPLPAVLAFPALGVLEIALNGVSAAPLVYFGVCFLVALVLGFARQAFLVVANRRAAAQERSIRAEATRRNQELEALTSLAATMTESFEEDAILDRGLEVVRLGARASSAALHLPAEEGLELRAITGNWQGLLPKRSVI